MDNNVEISEELKNKNQELLLRKRVIDLETAMESLALFFKFHIVNMVSDINNRVCMYQNITIDSDQALIYNKTITTFLEMTSDKLKNTIDEELNNIKSKINSLSNEEYSNELKIIASSIKNKMLDFFLDVNKDNNDKNENFINMLTNELCLDQDEELKNRVYKYLYDVFCNKMINILQDNLMISIQLISNNNKENQEVMERINEKTVNRV